MSYTPSRRTEIDRLIAECDNVRFALGPRFGSLGACPASLPAGADEPKPNPPHRITADPSVLDSDANTGNVDGVECHSIKYATERGAFPRSPGADTPHVDESGERVSSFRDDCSEWRGWSEAERLAFLERARKA